MIEELWVFLVANVVWVTDMVVLPIWESWEPWAYLLAGAGLYIYSILIVQEHDERARISAIERVAKAREQKMLDKLAALKQQRKIK